MFLLNAFLKSCSSANTGAQSLCVLTFDVFLHRCVSFLHLKVTFIQYGLLAEQHGLSCKPFIRRPSSRFALRSLWSRLLAEQHDLDLRAAGHAFPWIQMLISYFLH